MRTALGVAVVFGMIGVGSAFAQSDASTTPAASPPVVSATSSDPRPADAPGAGANSFTEKQARSSIEAHGYANVGRLTKDDNSIWRGRATKGGAPVSVALDYQGKIFPGR